MEEAADIKLESKGMVTFDTNDPMANYTVGTEGYTLDLRNATQETTPIDKFDYLVPLPENVKKHTDPLPMSYLNVHTLEEGEAWYRKHYPAVPDELLPIMARYSFGDLGQWTHKELKNYKKKARRRAAKASVNFKTEPTTVVFE